VAYPCSVAIGRIISFPGTAPFLRIVKNFY
jgi:hypothetical protein